MKEPYPYIRPATDEDYPDIWRIWMQDHIIRWMSFTPMRLEDFKSIYDKLKSQSDIYVMVDSIDSRERVVGVRRIKYLKDQYAHVAEFCSMGIDNKLLGHGYGKKFTEEFEKIVASKHIKRIQLTQDGGNNSAFALSDRYGYQVEAIFPDWLKRDGEQQSHHFVIERHIYKFIDTELQKRATDLSTLKYEASLPALVQNSLENLLSVSLSKNKIVVLDQDKTAILEFEYFPDDSVIKHIAFLDNIVLRSADTSLNEAAFRKALSYIYENEQVKKLELFTYQSQIAALCQRLGFWVRGERLGVHQIDNNYYNELGVEYSYFGIDDTINFIKSFNTDTTSTSLHDAVLCCKDEITKLMHAKKCDILGSRYLQNIVYQMVRDSQPEKNYVALLDKPWQNVITQCPEELQVAFHRLNKELQKPNQLGKNSCLPSQFFVIPVTTKATEKHMSMNVQKIDQSFKKI